MTVHLHCPYGCDHPQAFNRDGVEFCGRCWHLDGVLTAMAPCTADLCRDDEV